jgi:L-amino acid N-acyltransferase YncA
MAPFADAAVEALPRGICGGDGCEPLDARGRPVPIRRLHASDIDAVVRICNYAIARGESTYGPDPVTAEQMLRQLCRLPPPFESFVYDDGDGIVGWAGLTRFTEREIYDTTPELGIFVAGTHRRRGIGRALARHVLARAAGLGFHGLVLILQPEPTYLMAWAIRHGFRSAGSLPAVLPVGTEWRDIIVFQKFLSGELGE